MNIEFQNLEIGKYVFFALLYLFLLYLIRPKLEEKTIPSLMFLMKDKNKSRLLNWFKKLIRDPLFFIQFFIIIVLALAAIAPVVNYQKDVTAKNTVLVLDMSASMTTGNRFNEMMTRANEKIQGDTSIILAENKPMILTKDASEDQAKNYLKDLKAKDTTGNLADAILVASDILNGREGKIVVISDFKEDADETKTFLENKGLFLEYIDVSSKASNVGIIDYNDGKVYLKNFNKKKETITLKSDTEQKITLGAGSIEAAAIKTNGVGKIEIVEKDDFMADNNFYFSSPKDTKMKVLLITNDDKSYMMSLLKSMKNVELEISRPPIVPTINHDIVILAGIDKEQIAIREVKEVLNYAKSGGNVVIVAQDDISSLGLNDLLPVEIIGFSNKTDTNVVVQNAFTKEISFGSMEKHTIARNKENVMSIVVDDDNNTLVSFGNLGKGQIIYYGLTERYSNMQFTPNYPIFWSSLFNFLTRAQSFEDLNKKTGDVIVFNGNKKIKTPSGEDISTDLLVLEEIGIYKYDDKQVAANLINEKESDVNKDDRIDSTTVNKKLKESIVTTKLQLDFYLMVLALLLILFELFYIKRRGDV